MTKRIEWDWTPGEGVGPFRFGAVIADSVEDYGLTDFHGSLELESALGWFTYQAPGKTSQIHVEDGVIVAVSCHDSCRYEGFELIGAPLASLIERFGRPEETGRALEVEDEIQATAEFPRHGLQVWLRADETVASTLCGETEPSES